MFAAPGLAQDATPDPRTAWLREHAATVRSIDPADEDFADLAPLGAAIGEARVVGLGEQTHGDGATFHAKVRLVKFLHAKLGFDVLVWESGMAECDRVEQALQDGTSMRDAWSRGIFPVWARSEQVQPLFDYIDATRQTERPLRITGMDAQMTGRDSREASRSWVEALGQRAGGDATLADAAATLAATCAQAGGSSPPKLTEAERYGATAGAAALVAALEAGESGAFAALDAGERALAVRTLRNLSAAVEMMFWFGRARGADAPPDAMERGALAREPAMADTMVWLAQERFASQKLIVWAASSHLTFRSATVEMQDQSGAWRADAGRWRPMGDRVREALGDSLYVIDFLAYEGKLGNASMGWSRDLEAAAPDTIDGLCHATGIPFLFVDLRRAPLLAGGEWLREPQVARPRGYAPMRAVWGQVCDAFFFTDRMYPSTRAAEGK